MQLTVKPYHRNTAPLAGFLIRGSPAAAWIRELQLLQLSLKEVALYPVPGTAPNTVWGCLAVTQQAPDPQRIGKHEACQRIGSRLRGGDCIGRFSGNRFGVVLKNCGPDDLAVTADRLLAAVRDDMVPTSVGPVAVTVTGGGVVAPRHARTADDILVRAQEALGRAKAKRRGSFLAYRPSVEREALRRAARSRRRR